MSDEDHELPQRRCVGCGSVSPNVGDYDLIGPKFGWRLTRRDTTDGQRLLEWRCPNCWAEYRKRTIWD